MGIYINISKEMPNFFPMTYQCLGSRYKVEGNGGNYTKIRKKYKINMFIIGNGNIGSACNRALDSSRKNVRSEIFKLSDR